MYVITMMGESSRIPFDLPEGEGEIVGGFHTEYSSLKFAMFFLAEYINIATLSALATTLFLGGWRAPWPISTVWSGANSGWWPVLWFLIKLFLFIFFFIWLRGTLPRVRYDQLMKLGWKVLMPFSLGWILLVAADPRAAQRGLRHAADRDRRRGRRGGGLLVATVIWETFRRRRGREGDRAPCGGRGASGPTRPPAGSPSRRWTRRHYHGVADRRIHDANPSEEVTSGTN